MFVYIRGQQLWEKGTIIDYFYREVTMPNGYSAPYQVELDNGTLIWVSSDTDRVIRKWIKSSPTISQPVTQPVTKKQKIQE